MAITPYATVAEANSYFDEVDITSKWETYTDEQKLKSLNLATKIIDSLPFKGQKYDPEQERQFPRFHQMSTSTKNIYRVYDVDVDGAIKVPEKVKEACMVQAKNMLDNLSNPVPQMKGITSISVGSTSESYDLDHSPINSYTKIYKDAEALLHPYMIWSI